MNSKVAIVTGGSRGIGAAIVKRLAMDDFNILLNFRSNQEAALAVQEQLQQGGSYRGELVLHGCDVSQYANCTELVKVAIQKWGCIDVLINNAGISKGGFLMMNQIENWWEVVHTNLGSTMNCTRAVIPQMVKQKWGRIINIGSVSGIRGTLGNSDYSASKAAIIGFTKAMARELVRFGIIVNCIAPGFIESEMTGQMPEKQKQGIMEVVPMKRMGKPEEVAELVALLASGKVDYVLGQTIVIDGGISM